MSWTLYGYIDLQFIVHGCGYDLRFIVYVYGLVLVSNWNYSLTYYTFFNGYSEEHLNKRRHNLDSVYDLIT